ncbi:glycosyltransferase involved in cell wall biosynthesis [Orbus hercynius]|uniref:Glycosyltransferase involved in cell wall biosynthesis n=1 Tax=Orbus hercynius TaxID=593135 RepID=A0A495RBR0_9GAMM|nr:glycosyltransferase family 1 protein [Orbus hercynius]RKS84690.1 glycosyltransferase involved in cell wall biosynthesis [Orbus hercynius]
MNSKVYINGRFLTQNITGVQRFALEICKELIKLRDDVVFLVPSSFNERFAPQGFNIEIVGKKDGLYWEQVELPRFLNKHGAPLLISLCNRAPLFYQNNILVLHDITFIRYPESFSRAFLVLYKFLVPKLIKKAKKVLTVSDFSRREIADYYKVNYENIDIIYNAVSDQFFPANKEHGGYFLAVSSDVYNKNFERLILAFNQLTNSSRVKLKVVGRAGVMTNKYSNNANIEFVGRVCDDELIKLYQNAIAFIFPSIYEGFGIPPLEAQACGCPVLSSDVTAMPEVLAESVYYFNPLDINDITQKIAHIETNDQLRNELIQKGFNNVKRFSWNSSAKKLVDIYNSIR